MYSPRFSQKWEKAPSEEVACKVGEAGLSLSDITTEKEEVQKRILHLHNKLRSKVSPPAQDMLKMEWNLENAQSSQKIADQCKMVPDESDGHHKTYAENLFKSPKAVPWEKVLAKWIVPKVYFKYGLGSVEPGAPIETYLKMVWYSTHEIGCAVAHCPGDEYLYVCHYSPIGFKPKSMFTPYEKGPRCGRCLDHCNNGLCPNRCDYYDVRQDCRTLGDICDDGLQYVCKATCYCRNEIA
ncbi:PREDICTED: serotriflin-like [Chinchilla lanigera]|uniref:serotriflin-like n=1 Tax=Chinchilla lanigera TaxID=34839 RepID=UPI0006990576|nr:PREDICTED: serotriflin-like [Chinchilla lanigera]